jgi:hypothetical protein
MSIYAAVSPTDPAQVAILGAATDLKDNLVAVGTSVLPLAAVVLAITLGWRFAKRFVRG